MEHEIEFDFGFSNDVTTRCKIKPDYYEADKEGEYFGYITINNRKWAVVLWDGEDDPDLFKAEGLLLAKTSWTPLER